MFIQITAIGRLGKAPEMKFGKSGVAYTRFSVAVNRRWAGKDGEKREETTWLRCTAFNGLAESVNEHVDKGDLIFVQGWLAHADPQSGLIPRPATGVFRRGGGHLPLPRWNRQRRRRRQDGSAGRWGDSRRPRLLVSLSERDGVRVSLHPSLFPARGDTHEQNSTDPEKRLRCCPLDSDGRDRDG